MAVVKKSEVSTPMLPKETLPVPELKGDVVVCGLMLSDRLQVMRDAKDGDIRLSKLLAMTVIDADGKPLFDELQWETFGATNFKACLNIFNVAKRLSGFDAEVIAKN
jgi:hypothetical protein